VLAILAAEKLNVLESANPPSAQTLSHSDAPKTFAEYSNLLGFFKVKCHGST